MALIPVVDTDFPELRVFPVQSPPVLFLAHCSAAWQGAYFGGVARCCPAHVALPVVVLHVVELQGYGSSARLCRRSMWRCSGPSRECPLPFWPLPDTELLPYVLTSLFLCLCPASQKRGSEAIALLFQATTQQGSADWITLPPCFLVCSICAQGHVCALQGVCVLYWWYILLILLVHAARYCCSASFPPQ